VLVGGHQEAAAAMGGVVPEGAALAAQHGRDGKGDSFSPPFYWGLDR